MNQSLEVDLAARGTSGVDRFGRKLKNAVRPLFPKSAVRFCAENRAVVWLRINLKRWLHRHHTHEEIYGADYYEMVDSTTGQSAGIMAQSIVDHLHPESVVDLGCGPGNLLEELRSRGLKVRGAEFAPAALALCRERGLDVVGIDFTDPAAMEETLGAFDLAICMEVAQQIPPADAKNLIGYLCRHANTVLFTSAPCARDRMPMSAKTPRFWIAEFAASGFELDEESGKQFQAEWREKGTAPWFAREPMVFRKAG